jgi:hypothetical protein
MQIEIERESFENGEKTILPLDKVVNELTVYDKDFFERYFAKGGIWLTDKFMYRKLAQ